LISGKKVFIGFIGFGLGEIVRLLSKRSLSFSVTNFVLCLCCEIEVNF